MTDEPERGRRRAKGKSAKPAPDPETVEREARERRIAAAARTRQTGKAEFEREHKAATIAHGKVSSRLNHATHALQQLNSAVISHPSKARPRIESLRGQAQQKFEESLQDADWAKRTITTNEDRLEELPPAEAATWYLLATDPGFTNALTEAVDEYAAEHLDARPLEAVTADRDEAKARVADLRAEQEQAATRVGVAAARIRDFDLGKAA